MTVRRKATRQTKSTTKTLDDIINKGGKTTTETDMEDDAEIRFTLRIPQSLIQEIDQRRKERVGNVSRNQWILEAISTWLT